MANTVHEGVKAYDNLAYGSMGPRIPVPALPPMASGDQPIDPDLWQRAEHENAILGLELHQVKLESVQKPGQKSHNWPLYTPSGRLAPFTKNFFEHLPVDPPTGLVSIFTDKPPACSLVLAAQTQTQTRLQQLTGDLNKKLETSHGLYLRIAPLPTAQRPHQKWAGVQPQRAAPVDAAKHSVFSAALTFQGDQPQKNKTKNSGSLGFCGLPSLQEAWDTITSIFKADVTCLKSQTSVTQRNPQFRPADNLSEDDLIEERLRQLEREVSTVQQHPISSPQLLISAQATLCAVSA